MTAIILAGGRSSRFGRDKLAEPLDDRPLLAHAIESLSFVAGELIVVTAPGAAEPPGTAHVGGVRIIRDATPFEGPLAGALAGLEAAADPIILLAAGDMPSIPRGVLELLLDRVCDVGDRAAVLLHDGRPQPLPMALRRDAAQAAARELFDQGVRRLGALVERLEAIEVPEPVWRAIDPAGMSLRDIDVPNDLPWR